MNRIRKTGSVYHPPEVTPQTDAYALLTKKRADIVAEIEALKTPKRSASKRPRFAQVQAKGARLAKLEAELEALDYRLFDAWDAERMGGPTTEGMEMFVTMAREDEP